ncbi:hypothetical protein CTEN210_01638 [Chaetoceros tenuissimus]|uniref:Uncharacterized protein n=1 Tax=Chaetoceros tenuissimus TaxID=426638 RepID=A0AAD3CHZ8_9STRA|nr:hypothetical protein CTEN210_01638 [Chaetoceros tenuissimus]
MIRICARELKGSTSRRSLASKIRVRCFSRIPAPTWSVEELNLNSSKNSSINVIQDDELNLLSQRCLIDLNHFSDEERQDLKNDLGKMMKCISLVCETDTKELSEEEIYDVPRGFDETYCPVRDKESELNAWSNGLKEESRDIIERLGDKTFIQANEDGEEEIFFSIVTKVKDNGADSSS